MLNDIRMQSMMGTYRKCEAWVFQDKHKAKAREWQADVERVFTEHPKETGETYLEHLWFAAKMSMRFMYLSVVILLHGLFPFIYTRTASSHIIQMHEIIKTRIPRGSESCSQRKDAA